VPGQFSGKIPATHVGCLSRYIYIQMRVFCSKLLIIDYQKDTKKQIRITSESTIPKLGMSSKYRQLDV